MTRHDDLEAPPRAYWPTERWRSAPPEAQGLSSEGLEAAYRHLLTHAPHIDSLLVIRHGWLVFERYRHGTGPDTRHNLKSVTKSVTSLLTGIALQTGDLPGIDETLGYILPEAFTLSDDQRKRAITLRHLLTMRSGLAWEEYGASSIEMTAAPDWVRFVLDRPLAHPPGVVFNYSTGDSHLLAAALTRLTGMALRDFADLTLFAPLGITAYDWPADPQGVTIGGSELRLTPRDMAKIGFLVLNRGTWNGTTVVSPEWIAASHQPHNRVSPHGDAHCDDLGYGYQWWLRSQGSYASALAVGYGGQFIITVPALDLAVVMTGDIATAPEAFRDNRMLCAFNLVEDYIVPAATT